MEFKLPERFSSYTLNISDAEWFLFNTAHWYDRELDYGLYPRAN